MALSFVRKKIAVFTFLFVIFGFYKTSFAACNSSNDKDFTCSGIITQKYELLSQNDVSFLLDSSLKIQPEPNVSESFSVWAAGSINFTSQVGSSVKKAFFDPAIYLSAGFNPFTIEYSQISNLVANMQGSVTGSVVMENWASSGITDVTVGGNISSTSSEWPYSALSILNAGNGLTKFTLEKNATISSTKSRGILLVGTSIQADIAGKIEADKGNEISTNGFFPSDISVITRAGSSITSNKYDALIIASADKEDKVNIDISGTIKGEMAGLRVWHFQDGDANIKINGGAKITGNVAIAEGRWENDNLRQVPISNTPSKTTIIIDGSTAPVEITGTSGVAILFESRSSSNLPRPIANINMTITGNVTIDGDVDAVNGNGTNTVTVAQGAVLNFTEGSDFLNFQRKFINGIINIIPARITSLSSLNSTEAVSTSAGISSASATSLESTSLEPTSPVVISTALTSSNLTPSKIASLEKIYSETASLENISSSNSNTIFTANTTISLAPFVLTAGTIVGSNAVINGDVIVKAGAIFQPGDDVEGSVGVITINGNITFEDGAILNMDVGDNNLTSDSIIVSGTTNVSGAILNIFTSNLTKGGSVTILKTDYDNSSGGSETILGKFKEINIIGKDGLVKTTFVGGSDNSENSANNSSAFITFITANASSIAANLQSTINSSLLFNDTITDEIANGAYIKDRHFWVRSIYRNQNAATQGARFGFNSNNYGIAIGAQTDIENSPYKVGFSLSTIHENLNIDSNQGGKQGDAVFASIYGIYNKDVEFNSTKESSAMEEFHEFLHEATKGSPTANPDAANVKTVNLFTSLALGFGYHNSENERAVDNGGIVSMANSTTNDMEINATIQAGAKLDMGKEKNWYISPRISASYIHTFADGFNEANGGAAAISIGNYSFDSVKFREVIRFGTNEIAGIKNSEKLTNFIGSKTSNALSQVKFSPYVEVGLAQERALNNKKVKGSFSNGDPFNANLPKNDRNFFTTTIGSDIKITEDTTAFVSYQRSQDFKDESRNSVNVGVRVRF